MPKDLHVGDLVAPRDQVKSRTVGLGSDAGVVIEIRRSDCKIFNPETRRSFWMERNQLVLLRVVSGERSIPAKMNRLLRCLEATECELHPLPDGVFQLDVCHGGMDLALLDEIRQFMNEDLVGLSIEPQGMGAIKTIIQFR